MYYDKNIEIEKEILKLSQQYIKLIQAKVRYYISTIRDYAKIN